MPVTKATTTTTKSSIRLKNKAQNTLNGSVRGRGVGEGEVWRRVLEKLKQC